MVQVWFESGKVEFSSQKVIIRPTRQNYLLAMLTQDIIGVRTRGPWHAPTIANYTTSPEQLDHTSQSCCDPWFLQT